MDIFWLRVECCSYYRTPASSYDYSKLEFNNKIVKTDKSLANDKYKNINYYVPEGMVVEDVENNTDNYIKYYVNKEDINKEKGTTSTKRFYVIDPINCEDLKDDSEFRSIDVEKMIKKYNLNNKFDVLDFYIEKSKKKVGVFSSYNDIKLNYFLDYCSSTIIIRENFHYYKLDGDLIGLLGIYDYNLKDGYKSNQFTIEVYNGKENKYYHLSFHEDRDSYNEHDGDIRYKEIFDDELMGKVLSSIYFD